MNGKTSPGDARETDERNLEISLRTQTTTRQRYDEIKKKKEAGQRKSGRQRCLDPSQSRKDSLMARCGVQGLGVGGTPEHVCPLPPTLLFLFSFLHLFHQHHSIQSPSSNSDSSSESEYSTAMRRDRMVATSLPTRSCLASCSRCSSTFRSCMPGMERGSKQAGEDFSL